MKCGFCERELEASLIPVDPGFQAVCACGCGAVWAYNIPSLRSMALVQKPRWLEEEEPHDDSDDRRLPLKHPAN